MTDLDKLEALAVALRVSWSGRGWVASKKIDGLLKEARQAADGLTSLIASARRDAEEIERLRETLIQADLKIRSLPGTDQSCVEFIRLALDIEKGRG